MIRYSYHLHNYRHWLSGFSELLQKPAGHRLLTIPSQLGEGGIYAPHLTDGLSGIVMNFRLLDDLVLYHPASTDPGLLVSFDQIRTGDRGIVQLTSTANAQEITLPRNIPVKRAALFFSPSFLKYHIRKDFLEELFQQADKGYKEPLPFEYRQQLEDIFNADPTSPLHHLQIQNRFNSLTEKLLHTLLSRTNFPNPDPSAWARGKEKDLEALKSIVQILSDTQLHKFPSIETLSKKAMMSSTKLKSRFKQIYGMKLYEFYNRHRLEQAKEMLKTGKFSVKQVGVNIGFSNLSNFAKAFKKEFGILPKDVLRNK